MEFGYSRHRSNAFTSQLRQLFAFRSVQVNETVHVTDAKALNAILRKLLPLGS
jgi:hypothetical protein